jgi:CubicO group peptidase (beta-lactamase class C family)
MGLSIIILILVLLIYLTRVSLPIISGFNAKQTCTGIFVSGRDQQAIKASDLNMFPLNLAVNKVDFNELSVTTTVFGMAKKKAIYRPGIGCTLVNEFTETEIRAQKFDIPIASDVNVNSIDWPMGDKINDSISPAINIPQLNATIAKAFTEPNPRKKQRTRSVVVLFDGQLVAEKYAPGFDKDTKLYGWSMAKSITAALIGTLVHQDKLDVTKPAPVPEWSDVKDPRHAITMEHLLQQTSGLRFAEKYIRSSDVTNMLYKKGDMAAFAAAHKLHRAPGTVFNYSSGNTNILARIIKQTVGEQDYAAYPFNALFNKIGMYGALFEPDASGTYVGSSYINATTRDYARFGLLYYNDGVWNGERILPEGWVSKTRKAPAGSKLENYGYQFWLNGKDEKNPSKIKYPDVPTDMFYCDGFGYQFIFIIPSEKLVVVRLGLTLDRSFDENAFLKAIIASVHSKG